MKKRSWSLLMVALVLLALVFEGCSQKSLSKDEVSDAARTVIETFMTCPNEDLYNDTMKGAIGSGTEKISDEEWEKINAAYEKVSENWEKGYDQLCVMMAKNREKYKKMKKEMMEV